MLLCLPWLPEVNWGRLLFGPLIVRRALMLNVAEAAIYWADIQHHVQEMAEAKENG